MRISLKLDHPAYGVFKDTAHLPRSDPRVDTEVPVEAYFFLYTDSSVDIISTDTLARMGYEKDSLLEVSTEGRKLFREARMSLKGAIFANLRAIDPTTQIATYTSSLMYVATCGRNHLSDRTVEALGLGGHNSLGDLLPLYIPHNV